jgi:hypothetical protein
VPGERLVQAAIGGVPGGSGLDERDERVPRIGHAQRIVGIGGDPLRRLGEDLGGHLVLVREVAVRRPGPDAGPRLRAASRRCATSDHAVLDEAPRSAVTQPAWVDELMAEHWRR